MSPIARATIIYQYASGDAIKLTVHADADHPDVYDELATRVMRMYREAVSEPAEDES